MSYKVTEIAGTVVTEHECDQCGATQKIEVPFSEWESWTGGEYIQNSLTSLTEEQREMFLSGTCASCWDKMFGEHGEFEEGEPNFHAL